MAPLGEALATSGLTSGALTGEDQQLLGVAPYRLIEASFDLFRRVDVGPVRGEGAVPGVHLQVRERESV